MYVFSYVLSCYVPKHGSHAHAHALFKYVDMLRSVLLLVVSPAPDCPCLCEKPLSVFLGVWERRHYRFK